MLLIWGKTRKFTQPFQNPPFMSLPGKLLQIFMQEAQKKSICSMAHPFPKYHRRYAIRVRKVCLAMCLWSVCYPHSYIDSIAKLTLTVSINFPVFFLLFLSFKGVSGGVDWL